MIQILLGIFGAVGLVVSFIKKILLKYVGHAAIISMQFTITASTILFVLTFYFFTITSLVSVYNLGMYIFSYITISNNSYIDCLYGLLSCTGISSALNNGFSMFYGALSTIALFHLFKFTFGALKLIGNEIFKLGLLIGQALN